MKVGFIVPAKSKREIYAVAAGLRHKLQIVMGDCAYVPIDRVYEALRYIDNDFDFEVCERSEMGADHGRAYPEKKLIQLREDVYDGMCKGSGRDRFTAAHELGHIFLHAGVGAAFHRMDSRDYPRYMDAEWQADTFASAFLIDERHLQKCRSIKEVQERFGVSEAAAQVRYKN